MNKISVIWWDILTDFRELAKVEGVKKASIYIYNTGREWGGWWKKTTIDQWFKNNEYMATPYKMSTTKRVIYVWLVLNTKVLPVKDEPELIMLRYPWGECESCERDSIGKTLKRKVSKCELEL